MREAGILLVAMKIIADYPQLSRRDGRVVGSERAAPGSQRMHFERMAGAVKARAERDGLVVVGAREGLKSDIWEHTSGIVLAAERGDFLEVELDDLDVARGSGLCHLQAVHYRVMKVGDMSTQAPRYNGLSTFGKYVVHACNRLGILVDVAHCNTPGIQQAIEISTKPVIYSHGWVTQKEAPQYSARDARAIHYPVAKHVTAKGGVIAAFPVRWRNPEHFAEYLLTLVGLLGAVHVGIGSDHCGLPSSMLSGYQDFPRVAAAPSEGGPKDGEVAAVMGGNYLRVLQQAIDI